MLRIIKQIVFILHVIMQSVIMINVVVQIVIAPKNSKQSETDK